jgi:hypothetical protein
MLTNGADPLESWMDESIRRSETEAQQRIVSNLKASALGVDHGLRHRRLQSDLDEFVFRFNRRRARQAAFRSWLGIAAAHAPLCARTPANSTESRAASRGLGRSWAN